MDRTPFAVSAAVLVSLVAAAGCGAKPSSPPQDSAPLVLAELQAASPGPWRRDERVPISITALKRMTGASYPPPAKLKPDAADDVESRWRAEEIAFPPVNDAADELQHQSGDPVQPEGASQIQQGAERAIGKPRILAALAAPEPVVLEPARALVSVNATEPVVRPRANARRSPQIVPLRQQAADRIRRGFCLAERNAPYQAQAEFIAALERVAEANDLRQNTRFYSGALTAAVAALAESSDFLVRRPGGEQVDMARIVGAHKTPILKNAALDRLAPSAAARRYCTYAQEQLAAAAAGDADASMALFGLARAAIAVGAEDPSRRLESTSRAIVLYQAAVIANPRNSRAANELSVILAQKSDQSTATANRGRTDWLPWQPRR